MTFAPRQRQMLLLRKALFLALEDPQRKAFPLLQRTIPRFHPLNLRWTLDDDVPFETSLWYLMGLAHSQILWDGFLQTPVPSSLGETRAILEEAHRLRPRLDDAAGNPVLWFAGPLPFELQGFLSHAERILSQDEHKAHPLRWDLSPRIQERLLTRIQACSAIPNHGEANAPAWTQASFDDVLALLDPLRRRLGISLP